MSLQDSKMKTLPVFLLLIGAVFISVGSENEHEVNQEFLDGYKNFTGNVYNELRKKHAGNFLVCPISVDILLSLVENGSQGETSKELVKGLSLSENRDKVQEAFSSLTPKLNVDDKYTLTSANKLYVKDGHPLEESFKKVAVEVYNAEVQSINFGNKEAAASEMNKWVEERTQNKIKDLVDKDTIEEDTRLILLNALYFHGNWVTKFNKEHTKIDTFYLDNDRTTSVELMEVKHDYNYFESDKLKAKFLVLPYSGKDVTLTVVLPNSKTGLTDLEDNINNVLSVRSHTKENVHVKLPKFKIETTIQFNDILKNLGISKAFSDFAEFGKINGEPLKISHVVQKAIIEVEEEGTTAAAATHVSVTLVRSGPYPRDTKEFIANHPFIFFLKYHQTVLFIGHYTGI